MNPRLNLPARVAILSAAGALISLSAATPLAFAASTVAAEDKVDVVNTETVQVYMDADGDILSRRVYEQLVLTGQGSVDIENPISDNNLRNLDGFSGFTVKDGEQITEADVDGVERLRTVSDYEGKLPLDIDIAYKLDGKSVKPGDIVGEDGELEVEFTVTNVTGEEQEITIPDGKGGTLTKTATVPLPIVGSLTTFAPAAFTDVQSGQANMAGDGKGGTKLSFTMTLFPPIGKESATFGYTADIEDGVVPRVEVSALPVNPLKSPSFATAATSYQGGADTGTELAAGATEIDTNLLKLRDGSADLLAGLLKLHAGSLDLEDGLAGSAAPGAKRLADGTGEALAGSEKLSDGAGEISDGLGQASSGGDKLNAGAQELAAGQESLAAGIEKLYAGVKALPAQVSAQVQNDPQYQALLGALSQVVSGIGTLGDQPTADPTKNTLLGGLNGLKYGLRYPGAVDCVTKPDTQCGILDGIATVKGGIDAQLQQGSAVTTALLAARMSQGCLSDPVCTGNLDAVLAVLPAQLKAASDALGKLVAAGDDRMIPGINLMRSKISTGANPATCVTNPAGCGAREALLAVQGGIPQLVQALSESIRDTLLANIGTGAAGCDPTKTLQCGANALADGTNQLSAGVVELVKGLALLDDGGLQLSAGAGDLADGLGLIDGGANELADGLGDAATGSSQLADGLAKAADGAPKLVDGAGRLSKEGTKVIAGKGAETAQNYGELYAVLEAGSQRAQTEDMAFGAPEGANGLTAYNFIVKGEDGEDGRNWARGIAGLGLLAAGGGVFAFRRRML